MSDGYVARVWIWRDPHEPDTHVEGPFDTIEQARDAGKALWETGWDGHEAHGVFIHEIEYLEDTLGNPTRFFDVLDSDAESVEP